MTNNDLRSLVAQLVEHLDGLYEQIVKEGVGYIPDDANDLMVRAWDSLDESKNPTDDVPKKKQIDDLLEAVSVAYSAYGWIPDNDFICLFDEVARLASIIEEGCDCSIDPETKKSKVRTVLSRMDTYSDVAPISVRDRLPQVTDLDDKGCCWFGNKLSFTNKWEWFYGDAVIYMRSGCTHWLPASTKVLPTIYE